MGVARGDGGIAGGMVELLEAVIEIMLFKTIMQKRVAIGRCNISASRKVIRMHIRNDLRMINQDLGPKQRGRLIWRARDELLAHASVEDRDI